MPRRLPRALRGRRQHPRTEVLGARQVRLCEAQALKPKITAKSARHGGARAGSGGSRPGAGRPPVATVEEKDAIAKAREKGRSALPRLMDIWLEQAEATKPVFEKDPSTGAFENVGDFPDWPARSRAIENIADRCGMPKQTQVESVSVSGALAQLVKDLAAGLPDDDDPESR